MSKTQAVRYDGPHEAVRLPVGVTVDRPEPAEGEEPVPAHVVLNGETVDVPAEIAGRPPSGEPGEDGFDFGEGLLASPDWTAVGKAKGPNLDELRDRARNLGIEGAGSMRKAELEEAVDEAEEAERLTPETTADDDDEAGDAGEEG